MRRDSLSALFWFALAVFGGAEAQSPDRTYRVGVLATAPSAIETMRDTTFPELAQLGFVEGRNLIIDVRFSHAAYIAGMGRQLLEAKPDALIGIGPLAISILRDATSSVPIVMSLGPDDPAAHGFADSLARPNANITGLIAMSAELDGKRLQLLREVIPEARRIAVFIPPDVEANLPAIRRAAAGVGLEFVDARAVFNRYEYPAAFAALKAAGAEALIIGSAPLFSGDTVDVVRIATDAGMPTLCDWRGLVDRGCLIGYGPDLSELRRRTAHYVARILRGASPSELPIEGPIRFELTLNLKTAYALGLKIPPTLLARADEVIE
jgi:putative ABC transport system substrate-binding protein